MSKKGLSFVGSNVTVLGNFNPAILRPEFISHEFSDWGLGTGVLMTPAPLPLIADIRYDKVRLFMDPNRMVVEDIKLTAIKDMSSPKIVKDYLDKLPYTPLQMIGLNLLAEIKREDLDPVWKNVAKPDGMPRILEKIGRRLLNMSLRFNFPDMNLWLTEAIILTDDTNNLRAQLTLTDPSESTNSRLAFNAEFQDVANDRGRVDYLAEHFLEVGEIFFKFLDVLSVEVV